MAHYVIVGLDNRGSDAEPFGRIYLGTKQSGEPVGSLGFTSKPSPSVWRSNQTPEDMSPITIERARIYLKRVFPSMALED